LNTTYTGWREGTANGLGDNSELEELVNEGWDLTSYDRIVMGVANDAVTYMQSTQGKVTANINGQQMYASRTVIDMFDVSPSWVQMQLCHEVGHGWGLYHAGFQRTTDGYYKAYGQQYDIMGVMAGIIDQYSGANKVRLGWVGPSDIIDGSVDGTHDLRPLELEPDVIRIPMIDSPGNHWYLAAREEVNGVHGIEIVHDIYDTDLIGNAIGTLAIDTTPETYTSLHNFDSLLLPGRSWTDPTGSFTVTFTESNTNISQVMVHHHDGNNSAPVIDAINFQIQQGYKGYWYMNASINATDPDGDDLHIFWNTVVNRTGFYSSEFHLNKTFGDSIYTYFMVNDPRRIPIHISDGKGAVTMGYIDLFNYTPAAPVINNVSAEKITWNGNSYIQFTTNITDIDSLTYFWEFGDGTTSTFRDPQHIYPEEIFYTVNLTVSDGFSTAFWSETIDMHYPYNIPPVAIVPANFTIAANTSFVLDGSASYDPDGWPNSVMYVSWVPGDLPDGTIIIPQPNQLIVNVTGLPPGVYAFTMSIFDGGHRVNATVWVTVV
jgi:hypothetical protein